MAHLMPWHQTPAIHGYWGWHWTMNHYNPALLDSSGHRQIASHFYPVTGPYDSDDTLILEYQTLLMKISGIDGVLVKWDGMANYLDYATNNASTKNTLKAIEKAGLYFGLVMEDYVFNTMITNGYMKADTVLTYGKHVMKYVQDNYFSSPNYIKISNQPVLLNFGPQYFKQSAQWDSMFSVLSVKPMFFNEDNRLSPVATGAFPWTPMSKSDTNGILQTSALSTYLAAYYSKASSWSHNVTTAFPGFHDIYKEAGVHNSYGYLDAQNGEILKSTLYQAVIHNPDIIQLQTWNDYGEGTNIEPTFEYGTKYLEIIQATRDSLDSAFPFTAADLQLPLRVYNARIAYATNTKVQNVLNRVFACITSSQPSNAKALLDSLLGTTEVIHSQLIGKKFSLEQNYPNPCNPATSITFYLPYETHASLKIFDAMGQVVTEIVNQRLGEGVHRIQFDASKLSSGVYFYRLETKQFAQTKKLLILK